MLKAFYGIPLEFALAGIFGNSKGAARRGVCRVVVAVSFSTRAPKVVGEYRLTRRFNPLFRLTMAQRIRNPVTFRGRSPGLNEVIFHISCAAARMRAANGKTELEVGIAWAVEREVSASIKA